MIKFCTRILSLFAISASVLMLLISGSFASGHGGATKVGFVYE